MQRNHTIPPGLCQCGCGQPTEPAGYSHKRMGWVKGQPRPYIHDHRPVRKKQPYLVDEATGCWVWQGAHLTAGYGLMTRQKRHCLAHRFYYQQAHGPIPDGLQIDHRCQNKRCVNPDHMEVVTNVVNTRRGPHVKLTEELVREIKALRGQFPQTEIARRYGVKPNTINQIMRGKIWRGV